MENIYLCTDKMNCQANNANKHDDETTVDYCSGGDGDDCILGRQRKEY